MASAQIVGAFVEHGDVCLAVRVEGDGPDGTAVEYVGRVRLDEDWQALTLVEKRAALVAAVKAVRDAQRAEAPTLPSLSGSVTL